MNLTKHFYKRWVERIVGIKTEKEVNTYIQKNRDQIYEHANKTFEYADFVWQGQIRDNQTKMFYIKDDTILVANTQGDTLVTVYKIDFGFPRETNQMVRKDLVQKIGELREKKEQEEADKQEGLDLAKQEVDKLSMVINNTQEQLDNYKKQKKFAEDNVKNIRDDYLSCALEMKRYAITLIDSQSYKEDVESRS